MKFLSNGSAKSEPVQDTDLDEQQAPLEAPGTGLFATWTRGTLVALVIAALMFVWFTHRQWVAQSVRDARVVSTIDALQVTSQQIFASAILASDGVPRAFGQLIHLRTEFDKGLEQLKAGDDRHYDKLQRYLAGLTDVQTSWRDLSAQIQQLLAAEKTAVGLRADIADFDAMVIGAHYAMQAIVDELFRDEAPVEQIYVATRQLMLLERMSRKLKEIAEAGPDAAEAADEFGNDAVLFAQVLNGLLVGDFELQIEPVIPAPARERITALGAQFRQRTTLVGTILANSRDLMTLRETATGLPAQSEALRTALHSLRNNYGSGQRTAAGSFEMSDVVAALGVLCLLLLAFIGAREARANERELARYYRDATRARKEKEQGVKAVVDSLGRIAEGDLRTFAAMGENGTVDETVREAANNLVEALQAKLGSVQEMTMRLTTALQHARNASSRLTLSSEQQTSQISDLARPAHRVASVAEGVSNLSNTTHGLADASSRALGDGLSAAQRVANDVQAVGGSTHESARYVQRLGESSQELGEVVRVLQEIADQSNVIALNAAIQSGSASDPNRSLNAVTDEIQRLAERAGRSAKRAESLVHDLQGNANQAKVALDKGAGTVGDCVDCIESALQRLLEVEQGFKSVNDTVQRLIDAATENVRQADAVSLSVETLQDLSIETYDESLTTSNSFAELSHLVEQTRGALNGFRLPGPDRAYPRSGEPLLPEIPEANAGLLPGLESSADPLLPEIPEVDREALAGLEAGDEDLLHEIPEVESGARPGLSERRTQSV